MNQDKEEKGGSGLVDKVVVAVKASREIPKTALVWALSHVVQPGDSITLLVVVPSQSSGKRLWGFPRFAGDCANSWKSHTGSSAEQKIDITDSCSQMILRLHDVYDPNKINVKIKIVSASPNGAVAAEAKTTQASWVVLDKQLKNEEKQCMEELQCNIVVMKRGQPKVLRLNLLGSPKKESEDACSLPSELEEVSKRHCESKNATSNSIQDHFMATGTSSELGMTFTATEAGTSSVSSSDPGTSPFSISGKTRDMQKVVSLPIQESRDLDDCGSGSDSENQSLSSSSQRFRSLMVDVRSSHGNHSKRFNENSKKVPDKTHISRENSLPDEFLKSHYKNDLDFGGDMKEVTLLSRAPPPGPPPLCSICQHKAPVFGKPPRWFSYAELELATGGFSPANFLAEGGFGSVHRGVLPDGLVVAVKQHKMASSQGDHEFCSEVEVLSCAQHRNVVMLIGFCIEDKRRLLVYEYICNGSLDSHLYGRHKKPLEWSARQKVAVGAARGLRYLHEECRVGCIIHRDMRPNNILVTHDFEPLVGDFGLARWQPDGDTAVQTRVIGTFGYLAPEYAQTGQITEKADVYSFGVVLVELVTGRKAVDLNRPKGQQCLAEWARPLLEDYAIDQLIDPKLGNQYAEHEVYCMLQAASLCIRRDPDSRPRMSQVLRILEGDVLIDSNYMSMTGFDAERHSRRMWTERWQQCRHNGGLLNDTVEVFNGSLSIQTQTPTPTPRLRFRDKARRKPYEDDV